MSRIIFVFSLFVFVLGFIGCSKEDSPTQTGNQSQTGTYVGTVASATESGAISLTINPSKTSENATTVTGTLTLVSPASAVINLTGIFSNNVVTLSGGNYSFTAPLSGSSFSGTYSGPNGSGQFNAQPSSNNSVKVFAGSYQSNTISGRHGQFNIVVNGTDITGYTVSASDGDSTPLTGTLSGTSITLLGGVAVGTLNGNTVSGTYDNGSGDSGVWSGTQVN